MFHVHVRAKRSFIRSLILAAALFAIVPAGSAFAGAFYATGHDLDFHCSSSSDAVSNQCHAITIAINYIRSASPDPSKPVLVLDKGALELPGAINKAFGAGAVPLDVVDPAAFATKPLNTATYSAIAIASDSSCGGCDLNASGGTEDSDLINARSAEIQAFFNAGGGLLYLAGASHGDGDPSTGPDSYYSSVPLPAAGKPVTQPFTLTDVGKALGLTDDDANCCATHNSFSLPPAGSGLQVAEKDSAGLAETLIAKGKIGAGGFTGGDLAKAVIKLPSSKKCRSRRKITIRIKRPGGIRIARARVYKQGKKIKTYKGVDGRVRSKIVLKGLPKGRYTIKIVVLTEDGQTLTGKRRYRTCTPKKKGSSKL